MSDYQPVKGAESRIGEVLCRSSRNGHIDSEFLRSTTNGTRPTISTRPATPHGVRTKLVVKARVEWE